MTTKRGDPESGEREVTIERLGAAGDGIAETAQGRLYVPLTLPGERWRVRPSRKLAEGWQAEPVRLLEPAHRAVPPCPHFGRCGGCRLQHLPRALYAEHKGRRIVTALRRRGLPTDVVEALIVTPPETRRRLRLGIARAGQRLVLGFRARASNRIEPVTVCPIARPELAAVIPRLALLLAPVLSSPVPAELSLTWTDAGLDLLVHADRPPVLSEREGMAAVAAELDLARVSWTGVDTRPEPLAVLRPVTVTLGTARVPLPPGAFLQAADFGERALQAAVHDWAGPGGKALDLFAGLGTLTFALAEAGWDIDAIEGETGLVAALRQGAAALRHGHIRATQRDLARRPLTAVELKPYDLVVLDPPRVGAAEQARELARSSVARVIYASCHPESFARDARLLTDGGYALTRLRPIDQFLYAAEVELIALFARQDATASKRA